MRLSHVVQVKSPVDQNQWRQILRRPFAAPTVTFPNRKESQASHCDYDFDEKDYRSKLLYVYNDGDWFPF